MQKTIYSKLLNIFIIVGSALMFIAVAVMPWILRYFFGAYDIEFSESTPLILTFAVAVMAVPFYVSLGQLKRVMDILYSPDVFTKRIPLAFNAIAVCAFIEAVFFILFHFLVLYTLKISSFILFIVCPFIAVTAGLLFLSMATVFNKAAEIKEENDLTF